MGARDFCDHAVNQLIKIKDGPDSLGSFLQPLQVCNEFIAQNARRNFGLG